MERTGVGVSWREIFGDSSRSPNPDDCTEKDCVHVDHDSCYISRICQASPEASSACPCMNTASEIVAMDLDMVQFVGVWGIWNERSFWILAAVLVRKDGVTVFWILVCSEGRQHVKFFPWIFDLLWGISKQET